MKEYDKKPPNLTKEKEIRSLPEKGFKIMVVKMIQNLENKVKLLYRLETMIKKMQEMFNKDLQEIKSQSIIDNAITKIKSTLEGTNSRITEAEDKISEVEDRMVAINEIEKKKELIEFRRA